MLEIGTGSGYMAALLARKAHKVVTLELVPELANMARHNLRYAGIQNADVRLGDGAQLTTADGRFDAIVLSGSVAGVADNLLFMLAIGGRFIALVGGDPGLIAYGANDLSETPTFVSGLWLYPVFPFAMVIGAWIAFSKRKNVLSAILSGLSFAPVAVLILAIWVQNWIWNLAR